MKSIRLVLALVFALVSALLIWMMVDTFAGHPLFETITNALIFTIVAAYALGFGTSSYALFRNLSWAWIPYVITLILYWGMALSSDVSSGPTWEGRSNSGLERGILLSLSIIALLAILAIRKVGRVPKESRISGTNEKPDILVE